ncbi:MAG: sigma-70 family RNA polymerase sigma factor [Bacteroidaceae bacterium]|nr:sigma-70 family RNA polymerase sigma factor [Bacteroidaceae bacterium]
MRKSIADTLLTLPDAELMQRVGLGNHEAYEVLYERYARRLGGFFLRMLAYDTVKVEDMVQELFTRVWQHRAGYRAAQPFSTWLYAMAYNLCKNDYRHEVVRQSYTAECMLREEPVATTDETIERKEMHRLLRKAVQALPELQRDAFLLHYDEELTVPEVARIVGSPEGTVKSRLAAALTAIKKQMKMNL